ncbi:MAG: pyridoxamine 5'-phosphate oxidase family protein [Roseiarcus sp.]|jgi:pyridoxine/pyridoxamine 5'-phosphate oxidase
MKIEAVFEFIRGKRLAIVSTVHASGAPESALVGIAVTGANEIVFDTLSTSRKALNLAARPAAALVVGWDDEISIQIEGVARRPEGQDLAMVKAAYFAAWPDGRSRETWPDIAYFAVRPHWLRHSRFVGVPEVVEFAI